MLPEIDKIKGIHPGVILEREIKSKDLKRKELAKILNEHPQTISAVLNGKRGINPKLSIKLAKEFNAPTDYFMHLQASYDVSIVENTLSNQAKPNLSKIRKILFWDTDITTIDWYKQRRAVIKRIFERGNKSEIKEIIKLYGLDTIKSEIVKIKESNLPSFNKNIENYLNENL